MSGERDRFLILLIAPADPSRTTFASLLKEAGLPSKSCDSAASGMQAYQQAPEFDLVVVDYRLGSDAPALLARLGHGRRPLPLIAINVPLKAEVETLHAGASCVLGAGYSPRSLSLQCLNIILLLKKKQRPGRADRRPIRDFPFGNAVISPGMRTLRPAGPASPTNRSSLTSLQLRLLQALKSAPGRTLDYEFLAHAIWRRPYQGDNGAIREALSSLRRQFKKLGLDLNRWVTTVHGQGCRYEGK